MKKFSVIGNGFVSGITTALTFSLVEYTKKPLSHNNSTSPPNCHQYFSYEHCLWQQTEEINNSGQNSLLVSLNGSVPAKIWPYFCRNSPFKCVFKQTLLNVGH
ncbi:hypothetical protein KIL84_023494 [Mauremys mutica]|uniref:Uncharacterized protein n=1 Tax=Mauremys mutica TaxID=74926 RepID=A0A9D3WRT2_9SAUR|nr:hypothetical protein KIL84_023494 [Mauremys mutica]